MKTSAFLTSKFLLASIIFLISIVIVICDSQKKAVVDDDILVYSVFESGSGTTLYAYDTSSGKTTMLLKNDERLTFEFSPDGRIAFSTGSRWDTDGELFIMDISDQDQPPFNLSSEFDMVAYPLGWSVDGNYLALASVIDDRQQAIHIWDGTTIIDITPENLPGIPDRFGVAWSHDGRLAFTTGFFGPSNEAPRSEIYIWDGESTFNLSQNPGATDREPVWNTNGEVAFGSSVGTEQTLLLWDGTSYVDGLPDILSFTRIAPDLDIYSPFSSWANDDLLAFVAYEPGSSVIDIFTWDGQTWSNMSQKAKKHSLYPQWSHDGHWVFIESDRGNIFDINNIYVRDESNDTVFKTKGLQPAWSSGGSLAFCRRHRRTEWTLRLWDRADVSTLAEGGEIFAQWGSGQTTTCSNG